MDLVKFPCAHFDNDRLYRKDIHNLFNPIPKGKTRVSITKLVSTGLSVTCAECFLMLWQRIQKPHVFKEVHLKQEHKLIVSRTIHTLYV